MINSDQNTCCDDEIVWVGGDTDLPEQHFFNNEDENILINYAHFHRNDMIVSTMKTYLDASMISCLVKG